MAEDMFNRGDPVIRRLQQAFSHEELATELAAIMQRAARYQEAPDAMDRLPPHRGLTQADLMAARQREPAAVTRVYTAYAPALFRFFMAEVGDRHEAQDLTGSVFLSAIEALPGFRGPVEALGGWLFRIARHDLYDYRRKQARSPGLAPLEDHLNEVTVAAGAGEPPAQPSGVRTVLWALRVLLDREGIVSRPRFIQLFGWLLAGGDRPTDQPLIRLSPREREVLELLGRGLSNTQISRELYISPHTVRTHIQNIQVKLEMHLRLEGATVALQHGWPADGDDVEEPPVASVEDSLVMAALQGLAFDQREVLLLRMFGGLTTPEVAAALGKTTGAVKALQHRGLASLARALGLRSSSGEASDRLYPSPDLAHPRTQNQQQG